MNFELKEGLIEPSRDLLDLVNQHTQTADLPNDVFYIDYYYNPPRVESMTGRVIDQGILSEIVTMIHRGMSPRERVSLTRSRFALLQVSFRNHQANQPGSTVGQPLHRNKTTISDRYRNTYHSLYQTLWYLDTPQILKNGQLESVPLKSQSKTGFVPKYSEYKGRYLKTIHAPPRERDGRIWQIWDWATQTFQEVKWFKAARGKVVQFFSHVGYHIVEPTHPGYEQQSRKMIITQLFVPPTNVTFRKMQVIRGKDTRDDIYQGVLFEDQSKCIQNWHTGVPIAYRTGSQKWFGMENPYVLWWEPHNHRYPVMLAALLATPTQFLPNPDRYSLPNKQKDFDSLKEHGMYVFKTQTVYPGVYEFYIKDIIPNLSYVNNVELKEFLQGYINWIPTITEVSERNLLRIMEPNSEDRPWDRRLDTIRNDLVQINAELNTILQLGAGGQ